MRRRSMRGETEPVDVEQRVAASASGYSSQIASSTFSPPRMPVSQSWTSATFDGRRSGLGLGLAGSLRIPDPIPADASRSLRQHLAVDLAHAADRPLPGELAHALQPAPAQLLAQRRRRSARAASPSAIAAGS